MPTLKVQKTLEELPKNRMNLAAAMRKAGYSESSCYTGSTRKAIQKYTMDLFHPEKTKKKILKFQKLCLKEKDFTNYARMIELEAKVDIPELRKQEILTDNPREITINYGIKSSEPIENKEDTLKTCS